MASVNVLYNGSSNPLFSAKLFENTTELCFPKIKISQIYSTISAYLQASRIQQKLKTEKLYLPLNEPIQGYIIIHLSPKNTLLRAECSAENIGLIRKIIFILTLKKIFYNLNTPITPVFKSYDHALAHKLTQLQAISIPAQSKKILLPNLFDYSLKELALNTDLLENIKNIYATNKQSRLQNLGHDHKYTKAANLALKLTAKNFITDLLIYLKNNQPYFFQREKLQYYNTLTLYAHNLLKNWQENQTNKPVIMHKVLTPKIICRRKYAGIFKLLNTLSADTKSSACGRLP